MLVLSLATRRHPDEPHGRRSSMPRRFSEWAAPGVMEERSLYDVSPEPSACWRFSER